MPQKTAIIIGAGPAGLTAALELLERTDVRPVVLEASDEIGGISRTVNYRGNRIDIGGHRFFSKSDVVMDWWCRILPLEQTDDGAAFTLGYQGGQRTLGGGAGVDPEQTDQVMLVRNRLSRIYYEGKFYSYPIRLELQTIRNLGLLRTAAMGVSYAMAKVRRRPEENLEDFYINRFGRRLYGTFFEDYTEKVWGVPCSEIAADWGAQRVKGLSVTKAVTHALRSALPGRRAADGATNLAQKDTETSLIEYYLYPKFGPGQMWETVAGMVRERGGEVRIQQAVVGINAADDGVGSVETVDVVTGERATLEADYVISSMPVKDLVEALRGVDVPDDVNRVATELPYRDFITVGLLMRRLKIHNTTDVPTRGNVIPDNWIYIQDPSVSVGRLQVFNNWSPYMVADPDTVWVGMEYFANEGDELWEKPDEEMTAFGAEELARIGIIDETDLLDSTVIRVKKTYPAYFGTYAEFDTVRKFLDQLDNLYLVGRNGQHRYNNQDHSMLTAMEAVSNIASGRVDKSNVWDVNVEAKYHESK
jgi:protoporphyrinogen oxidase